MPLPVNVRLRELLEEPVTLEQVREHLGLSAEYDGSPSTDTAQDAMLADMVTAAREWCEDYLECILARGRYEQAFDAFPNGGVLVLHRVDPSTVSVLGVSYVDADGDPQSLDLDVLQDVDAFSPEPRLVLKAGEEWPVNATRVRVEYEAGFPVPTSPVMPASRSVQRAILLLAAHLFEHREDAQEKALTTVPLSAVTLLTFSRRTMGV